MTLALLRRSLVIGLLFAVGAIIAALVAGETFQAIGAVRAASNSQARLNSLEPILISLRTQRTEIDQVLADRSIEAESAALAAARVQSDLDSAYQSAGGAMLNVQMIPIDEAVRVEFLWRGSQAEMEAGLNAFHQSLPFLEYETFRIRRVELGAESVLEVDAIAYQTWTAGR